MRLIILEVVSDKGLFIEGNVVFGTRIILSWHVEIKPREGESFEDARERAIKAAEEIHEVTKEIEGGLYGPN